MRSIAPNHRSFMAFDQMFEAFEAGTHVVSEMIGGWRAHPHLHVSKTREHVCDAVSSPEVR